MDGANSISGGSTAGTQGKTGGLGGFWALIVTQFQGAFNDNLFKFLMILFLVRIAAGDAAPTEKMTSNVTSAATIIFALPFILFPGVFGAISDRFSKQRVILACKYIELGIMALSTVAFVFHATWAIWALLFLLSTHSALFSPSKYGILPEILPHEKLSWGNGIIQMTTLIAIILGTGLAGPLRDWLGTQVWVAILMMGGLSLMGTLSARLITRPPAACPTQRIPVNPYAGMGRYFRAIWSDRLLLMTVIGYTYFWFAGAMLQQEVIVFCVSTLKLSDTLASVSQVLLALGIGTGSVAAGFLSRGKIETGLIPLGALGMGIATALLGLTGAGFGASLIMLFLLGASAGFFDVPLAATLQQRSPADMKGGIIATSNVLTFLGTAAAAGVIGLCGKLDIGPRAVFTMSAVMSLGVGALICWKLPSFVLRLFLWIMTNTIYRLHIVNRNKFPQTGGAFIQSNADSLLDCLALYAATDRPIVFMLSKQVFESRFGSLAARCLDVIRVDGPQGSPEWDAAIAQARAAISKGELVSSFIHAEPGEDGELRPCPKPGQEILAGLDAPILPVYLDNIFLSVWGYRKGVFTLQRPCKMPYVVTLCFGDPMPGNTSGYKQSLTIMELGSIGVMQRPVKPGLLHRAFVRQARLTPLSVVLGDARTPEMSFFKTYIASIILGTKLHKALDDSKYVGVLVPPSVGGALTNIAMQIMGRIPVNLNYTASADTLASCAHQCDMTQVITSRAFLEKLPIKVPGESIFLEDIMKTVTKSDRIKAMLLAVFCPLRIIEKMLGAPKGRSTEDIATIIFSSGSEGEPKGIMLSHHNVLSNGEGVVRSFPHRHGDCIMGILPFFHSFGFTATLWLPLVAPLRAVFHPSPLEAKQIGQLVQKNKCTVLITTPTFLQNYTRRCAKEELESLQIIVTGAEKLPKRIRLAYAEKFDAMPFEGYGTTECAPIVSVNLFDNTGPTYHHKGNKYGTIGLTTPGISVRAVDPDTGELLGENETGMLQVKGPNIMMGYLKEPEKTAKVLKDGWYTTGDIAMVDADGFVTITDRLARFSKIGGEMVPHARVEEKLHELLEATDQCMAVAGVPDRTKGERLVVLHTLSDEQLETLMARINESDLPNLWRPKSTAFHSIEQIPILGTGKMDLKSVKKMARELDPEE